MVEDPIYQAIQAEQARLRRTELEAAHLKPQRNRTISEQVYTKARAGWRSPEDVARGRRSKARAKNRVARKARKAANR